MVISYRVVAVATENDFIGGGHAVPLDWFPCPHSQGFRGLRNVPQPALQGVGRCPVLRGALTLARTNYLTPCCDKLGEEVRTGLAAADLLHRLYGVRYPRDSILFNVSNASRKQVPQRRSDKSP